MILKGLTKEQIERGVAHVDNARIEYMSSLNRHGTRWRVKLNVQSTRNGCRYYRRSPASSGRKISALCWHGLRAVMREWLAINGDTVINTAMAKYRGADEFELFHDRTGEKNIGSQMCPVRARDACDC